MRIPLSGGPIRLRPPQPGDGAARLALGNHLDIHRAFGGSARDFRVLTADAAEAWAAAQQAEPWAWIIEAEGRLIGAIRLHSLNPVDRRAMLAIGILDPGALGRGYGGQAMRLLIAHAFGAMGLHRLGVRVLADNSRAIRAYQAVGFVIEGREREAALIDGAWQDDLIMGLLASDPGQGPAA
ncbi:MAG: GNAT family protein [Paracoccaceae bacterium]